jgi:hypothetical protein
MLLLTTRAQVFISQEGDMEGSRRCDSTGSELGAFARHACTGFLSIQRRVTEDSAVAVPGWGLRRIVKNQSVGCSTGKTWAGSSAEL